MLNEAAVNWLLLFNPTDNYRLFNLAGTTHVGTFSGMAGLAAGAPRRHALIGVLLLWCAVPLLAATWVFSRREV